MSSFLGAGGGSGSGLTVGTTTITGGTSGDILYDNAGVLGERLNPYQILTGNLDLYVATTGSDSNPGTIGSPFATIQHALIVAAFYDYAFAFIVTIHVAAGTYTQGANLLLSNLVNCPINNAIILGASSTTTTIACPGINIKGNGPTSQWTFKDIGFDKSGGNLLQPFNGAFIGLTGTINFSDVSNTNECLITAPASAGFLNFINMTFTATGGFQCFYNGGGSEATVNVFHMTFNLPSFTFGTNGNWIQDPENGSGVVFWSRITFTNKANFLGACALVSGNLGLAFQTDNSVLTDFPGTVAGSILDNTVIWVNNNSSIGYGSLIATGGTPVGLAQNTVAYWKDTTNGQRTLAFNDAGTIYVKQVGRLPITQTTGYTFALTDEDGRLEYNSASPGTFTIPTNASVAFPIGTEIRCVQIGTGALTIAGAVGVTVDNAGTLAGQWASTMLYKRGTNEWVQTLV